MSRSIASNSRESSRVPGFPVTDIKDLGKKVASAIRKELGLSFTQSIEIQTSKGLSLRIATAPAVTRDDEGLFPVLQLRAPTERDGVYLETALDHEWLKGACYLTHVSLKLFFGPAPRTSKLKFRAEWDPRSEACIHAQPHWNIDVQLERTQNNSNEKAPWIPRPTAAPWASSAAGPTLKTDGIDLSHFHFAMSASWQYPKSKSPHSGLIESTDSLVLWISGCVGYTRDQLQGKRAA